jgi:hypothetical protein
MFNYYCGELRTLSTNNAFIGQGRRNNPAFLVAQRHQCKGCFPVKINDFGVSLSFPHYMHGTYMGSFDLQPNKSIPGQDIKEITRLKCVCMKLALLQQHTFTSPLPSTS